MFNHVWRRSIKTNKNSTTLWQIYIILLEVSHITNHPHPDKHGACAKEDAAHIIAGEDLGGKKHEWWTQKNTCSIKQKITAITI